MDDLAALRLQLEWGADEAIGDAPVDRTAPRAKSAEPVFSPQRDASPLAAPREGSPPPLTRAPPPPKRETFAKPPPALRAEEIAAACATIGELRAALEKFDGCGLSTTATTLVFSDGEPSSGLMLVGDRPDVEEDRAGKPFVGAPGQFLDRMFASIGLDRTRMYVATLIPWRPPGNRNPTDDEVAICLPFLLRHIALVRPRRLVTLGALSTRALLGGADGIRRMRGRWRSADIPGIDGGVPVLPMFPPAYLLATPAAKKEAWADLRMLRRTLDTSIT